MLYNNKQSLELSLINHYFSEPSYNDDYISASFLVIKLPQKQVLNKDFLNSNELKENIFYPKKRGIGDATYDADDRIVLSLSNFKEANFSYYVLCLPENELANGMRKNFNQKKTFAFDFIIEKENSFCSNYDYELENDNHIFKTIAEILNFIFCFLFHKIFNVKRISFKMNNNPVVLMKIKYIGENQISITYPIMELL